MVLFLFFVMSMTALPFASAETPAAMNLEDGLQSNEIQAVRAAREFISDRQGLSLVDVEYARSVELGTDTWVVQFSTGESELIEVRLDPDTWSLLLFFDEQVCVDGVSEGPVISSDTALLRAIEYLESNDLEDILVYYGYPDEFVEEPLCWTLQWNHYVSDVLVKDDKIEIRVNKYDGQVGAFLKRWSNSVEPQSPQIKEDNVLSTLVTIYGIEVANHIESIDLVYVKADAEQFNCHTELVFAAKLDFTYGMKEVWIDAKSGEPLRDVEALDNGHMVVTVWDPLNNIGAMVNTRFSTNNYDSDYYYDVVCEDIIDEIEEDGYWVDSTIDYIFHWGHGGLYSLGEVHKPYMVDGNYDTIYAIDVLQNAYGLMYPEFVYICSCYSGYVGDDWQSHEDYYFATSFVDLMEAEAFLGWDGAVEVIDAHWFTRVFYAYALNEYELDTSAAYADIIVGPNVDYTLWGNGNHKLTEYKDDNDASPGRNLGTAASGADWQNRQYGDPLWHPDEDWFCFTVVGEHYISIWVIPKQSDFDVGFIVYKQSSQVSRNTQGAGGTEIYSFTHASGTFQYRIRVCSIDGNGYGGSYDLFVFAGIS